MTKFKKGQTLECVPCGREVVISEEGASVTTVYCCGKPMKQKTKSTSKKKITSRTPTKKTTKKSTKK